VIHHDAGAVLLDAGLSARQIVLRMEAAGLDPGALEAIVVTHEHSDHVSGVRVLARRLGIPVVASGGTVAAAKLDTMGLEILSIGAGESVDVACIGITAFEASHDAAEPIGCVFESISGERVGVITDTGELTSGARYAIANCDIVGIECNHDEEMLAEGPYPAFLKRRILSQEGHLSNATAATEVRAHADGRLRELVALHLSDTNNTPGQARAAMVAAVDAIGSDARVSCAAGPTVPVRCACSPAHRRP
jgi:phosphoribosyl 1,2-cyclic phosphodiesterase